MEISQATGALGALAQDSRLKIFRLLVQHGPEGMAAGDIARKLKLPHNTLSFHVAALSRAGLVVSQKRGRSILYSVDFEGTRALLGFLVEDCCRGHPEICGTVMRAARMEPCPSN
jgi:DNA-binding transcriptional ArsR family regulator